MAINEKFLFLGTSNGLCRINIKTGQIKDYNYSFIGQVNDLILDDNILWVGSNNGLINSNGKEIYEIFIISMLIIFFYQENFILNLVKRVKTKQNKIDKFSLSSFAYASHSDSMKLVSYFRNSIFCFTICKNSNNYVAYYQVSISAIDVNGIQLEQFVLRDSIIAWKIMLKQNLGT